MVKPDYYDRFVCIGGKCKNNCCMGAWDIEVDDEALERFKRIGGDFGKRVLSSINDENVFIRKNGRCQLLSDDGWCEMVQNGHKLCVICDEYPRFTEYFDDYAARGVSLSCEAAAKIILDNKDCVSFIGESGVCDDELFELLMFARENVIATLQNRDEDIFKRLRCVIDYVIKLQDRINNNNFDKFEYNPVDRYNGTESLVAIFEFLNSLDVLNDNWHEILRKGISIECEKPEHNADEIVIEQLAVYFVFRYFMKAFFDCDALSKTKFMAISVMSIISLALVVGDIKESARLYSIEIEHSEENIDLIYDEFLFNEDFTTDNIIKMIR